MKTINLTVNGKAVAASVEPRTQLADFLRDTLDLTGTHLGCEHGVCGACTLLIDGVPARSCITLAIACDGASITTIEGFGDDDAIMRALREAFTREHALQCGYCTPGMLASARDVVLRLPEASERDIRVAMSGNLCRCTGYVGIVRAIQSVIAGRKAKGVSSPVNPRTALGPAGSGHAKPTVAGSASAPQAQSLTATAFPSSPALLPKGEGSVPLPSSPALLPKGEGSVLPPSPREAPGTLLPSPPGRDTTAHASRIVAMNLSWRLFPHPQPFSQGEKGASGSPPERGGSWVGTEGEGKLMATAPAMGKPQTTLQLSFSVAHQRAKVWDFFGRLDEVTCCLPGTSLLATPTDDHVEPRIRIKVGPIVAEFEGVADVVRDAPNYTGTIHGSARDTRSNSMTRGEIRYVLHEDQGGAATRVDIEVGYTLTGALAQFSRSSLVQDIAKRMTETFSRNLQARIDLSTGGTSAAHAAQPPAAELDAGSLIFSVLWERIKRFLRALLGRN